MNLDYKSAPILIVDDEPDIVATFRFNFEGEFSVLGATNGAEAFDVIAAHPVAVLVCDQRMPDMSGVEVMRRALELRPEIVPIVLTGFTDLQALIKAINLGAVFRYVQKPFDSEDLRHTLIQAIERHRLMCENARLVVELAAANERLSSQNLFLKAKDTQDAGLDQIVGQSSAMAKVRRLARKIVDKPSTVLLQGPTGTGKELIAKAIHAAGDRRHQLFVPVNCGAVTETLLESELFGHRKGAFTDAKTDKKGVFQLADGGTLFLDEIGEASLPFQVHLLRVLEEREVRPIGDSRWIKVDVRVIAATNRDLESEVREGRFREDLYYRLKVFPIALPSLGERREDIPQLVHYFINKHTPKARSAPTLSAEAMAELEGRDYRGNVRELSNLIERALLMTEEGEMVEAEHLFDRPSSGAVPDRAAGEHTGCAPKGLYQAVERLERRMICDALERVGGNRKQAAVELGISYRWLMKKMQRYSLKGGHGGDEE